MLIIPQRYHLGIVLSNFYFPLTVPDIFASLSRKKFTVNPPANPLPTGIRRYVDGTVARKESVFFGIHPDRNLFSLDSDSNTQLLSALKEILEILESDFEIDVSSDIEYVEIIADLIIKTKKNPIETMSKFSNKKIATFDEIIGIETAPRILSIAPRNTPPNVENWFEIQISPRLTKPNTEYFLNYIFRNKNLETVTEFLAGMNRTVIKLIETIE